MLFKKFEILDIESHKEKINNFYEKNGHILVKNAKLWIPHKTKTINYFSFVATAALVLEMIYAGIPVSRHPLHSEQYLLPEKAISETTFNDLLGNKDFMYIATVSVLTTGAGSNQTWTYNNTFNKDNNSVECLGGGASGGAAQLSASAHATGGGAGAYSKITNFNPAGANITYRCGSGGTVVNGAAAGSAGATAGTAGGVTWWNASADPGVGTDNTKASAAGGGAGQATNTTNTTLAGGTGGATGSSWGQTKYAGGAGGAIGTGTHYSATGGGAPGVTNTGGNGTASNATLTSFAGGVATGDSGGTAGSALGGTGGTGTFWTSAGAGGGGGGDIGNTNTQITGGPAGNYGAGGGAATNYKTANPIGSVQATSGAGSQGIIVLTWTRKRVIIGTG